MPPYPLTNFEIQKYYQNEPKFNGAYSKSNLPKIKDGANVINLDEFESIGPHCKALYLNANNIVYFDTSGVEHIPNENKKLMGNKNIMSNIHRIQARDLIMCGLLYWIYWFYIKGYKFIRVYKFIFSSWI